MAEGTMRLNKKSYSSLADENMAVSALLNEIEKWGCEVSFQHADNEWVKSIFGH